MRAFRLSLFISLLAGLLAAACSGNPGDAARADAPPAAAEVSTRLTWYQAAASIPQSRYQIVEDPSCTSGPGCLTDPVTGKHYRRTDQGPQAQDPVGAAGDGYSQIDIVARDGASALIDTNVFVIDRTFNGLVWNPLGRARVDGAVADGLWIHPSELARLEREGLPGVLMARGPYQIGDVTYDTLAFWTGSSSGRFSYTYDVATGFLVAANTSTEGATSPFRIQGEDPPRANNQLTMTRLLNVRQRSLPGSSAAFPDWVATGRQLRYSGSYNWINPIDPTTGNVTYPAEHTLTVGELGPGWAQYAARTVVPMLGQDQPLDGVSNGRGLYWYDTAALAAMTTGQLLDSDPITGERLTVSYAGPAADGAPIVIIEGQLPGVATRATYEVGRGVLTSYEIRMAATGVTVSLQLAEMR